jgi:hypothetical protein
MMHDKEKRDLKIVLAIALMSGGMWLITGNLVLVGVVCVFGAYLLWMG